MYNRSEGIEGFVRLQWGEGNEIEDKGHNLKTAIRKRSVTGDRQ